MKSELSLNSSNFLQFNNASLFSRFFTVLAGPVSNFVFSIVIFSCLFLIQGISVKDPVVGKINRFYEANYDLRVNDKINQKLTKSRPKNGPKNGVPHRTVATKTGVPHRPRWYWFLGHS